MSLFGDYDGDDTGGLGFDERIEIGTGEFDKGERLKFEKEMLGLYVSDHPLLGVEASLRRKVDCPIGEAAEREDGAIVVLGGLIADAADQLLQPSHTEALRRLPKSMADSLTVAAATLGDDGGPLGAARAAMMAR